MEYRKGIVFLRLKGNLTKRTSYKLEDYVNEIVLDQGLNNFVLNLNDLKDTDLKGVSTIYYTYDLIKKHKGEIFICLKNNEHLKNILKKQKVLNYIDIIENEIEAFKLVKV